MVSFTWLQFRACSIFEASFLEHWWFGRERPGGENKCSVWHHQCQAAWCGLPAGNCSSHVGSGAVKVFWVSSLLFCYMLSILLHVHFTECPAWLLHCRWSLGALEKGRPFIFAVCVCVCVCVCVGGGWRQSISNVQEAVQYVFFVIFAFPARTPSRIWLQFSSLLFNHCPCRILYLFLESSTHTHTHIHEY